MKLYVFDPHTHEFKDSRDAQKDIPGHPITDVLYEGTNPQAIFRTLDRLSLGGG